MNGWWILNIVLLIVQACKIFINYLASKYRHNKSRKMKIILAVAIGSCIGGISRYLLSQLIQSKFLFSFPFGTLGVNIIGCLLIGMVFGISEKNLLVVEWRMFLITGLLGGFTTFSAFSMETILLIRNGQYALALTYIGASVIVGLLATFMGLSLIKLVYQ